MIIFIQLSQEEELRRGAKKWSEEEEPKFKVIIKFFYHSHVLLWSNANYVFLLILSDSPELARDL